MHVLSIYDLDSKESVLAINRMRIDANKHGAGAQATQGDVREAVNMVGGRLAYLSKVFKYHLLHHNELTARYT